MSNGDDEPADEPTDGEEEAAEPDAAGEPDGDEEALEAVGPTVPDEPTEESLTEYLDAVDEQLESATTEADLDDVDVLIDDGETALGEADLPEPDDEDEEGPHATLEARIEELRSDVEQRRGPYAEDVAAAIEAAADTVAGTRWTETGAAEVETAVDRFGDAVADAIGVDVEPESNEPGELAVALESAAEAVSDAGLDPDDDADTIAALIEAVDALEDDLEAAEEWDDLETHEQFQAQGYYDVLGHYKDYPVEWAALKEHEKRGNTDMILLALDSLMSDFMERHCLEALQRMGRRAATDDAIETMLDRAGKRDKPAIRILGKMAAEEATETLVEYVDADSDPALQKVTFKALGEIGAEEAVQPLANKLEMDNDNVRPIAARALGLIGDTRAVDPLADAVGDDESDDVRAAAAWALRQIGTREALEAAAEHADDRVFVVATEGQKARDALEEAAQPA